MLALHEKRSPVSFRGAAEESKTLPARHLSPATPLASLCLTASVNTL